MSTVTALPTSSTLSAQQLSKIQKSAQEFESVALGQLLAPMFETVDQSKGMFGGGDGEAQWRPMLVSQMAKEIAAHGGLGLTKPIMQQMITIQEQAR